MNTLKTVTTQTTKIELLADETGAIVRTHTYNDETGKFEHDESYGSPHLIDCEIEFDMQIFFLLK